MRRTSAGAFSSRPHSVSALVLLLLSLPWSTGCDASKEGAPSASGVARKPSASPTEASSNPVTRERAPVEEQALTAEQIHEREQAIDRLVQLENSQLPKRLEEAVDKLRLEALSEGGDGYKHAQTVQDIVFGLQGASVADLEGWRGVFLRPSSKAAFDEVLGVLRTHERALEEFRQMRPSARVVLQWNEVASRFNSENARFREIRGRCVVPSALTGMRDGRVQDMSRVVALQVAEADVLEADLESTLRALELFAVQAANFDKYPEDAQAALTAVEGVMSELRQIPGQAEEQEAWNLLAERWNGVAVELNDALERSVSLRREPEFPPHALHSNQDLLGWLDGIDTADRHRSKRASALQQDIRSAATTLAELAEAGSSFKAIGPAAREVRQAIDQEAEELERIRLIDRTQLVTYHRSVVQALPSELGTLDALTRFGTEIKARKDADPSRWSQDAWLAAYVDLQDSAFGAILAGAAGDHMDAATRNWAALTACKGWPLFLRSWAWDSMLGTGEKAALEARLRDWKATAQAVGLKEAVDLDTYLGGGVLNVVPAEGRGSWRAVLAAVTAEHRLLDLPPGCIEPMNAQFAVLAAGLASPFDSYHAQLVERFNRNRDVLDVSGMKKALSGERDRRPEMWIDEQKLHALYSDLQDLQLRAYFNASLSKTLPKVFDPFLWRKQPGDLAKFKEAARSQKLADVQGMLALIAGEAIDPVRFKNCVNACFGYPKVSLTSPELWQALAQELGDS